IARDPGRCGACGTFLQYRCGKQEQEAVMSAVAADSPSPSLSRAPSGGAPAAPPRDDAGHVLTLIVASTVAALVVVIALVAATAIDTWWSLAAVMVVHFAMTVAV